MPRENRSMVSSITDSRLADPEAYEVTCAHRYSAKRTPPRKRLRLRLPFVLYIFNPFCTFFRRRINFFCRLLLTPLIRPKKLSRPLSTPETRLTFKKKVQFERNCLHLFYNCSMTLSVRIFGLQPANRSGGPLTIAHAWRYVALLALHPF